MVIIVANLKSLKDYFKSSKVKCCYIYFGTRDSAVEKLLKANLCEEIKITDCPENLREELFQSYIDLIGQIGAGLNSIYWWASFTASKNRFISKLFPTLVTYYMVCNRLKESAHRGILLISPPYQLISALKQHCRDNSIEFKTIGYSMKSIFLLKSRQGTEHLVRIIYFVFKNWSRILYVRMNFKRKFKGNPGDEKYYVLRTWIYPSSISKENRFKDPFFGPLPEFLKDNKRKLVILAGIINKYYDTAKRLNKCQDYSIVPEEYFLKYGDIVRSVSQTFLNRIGIKNKIYFKRLDVSKLVQEEIDNDYRYYTRIGLLQKYIIKNMLNQFSIGTFTTTHENNPWEKVCFLSLRKYSPATKIIGYQHAVVTKASANMFISKEEMSIVPMPDKIITVGTVTKNLMEAHGCYPERKIVSSCALRHEYIYKLEKKNLVRKNTILVILEGVPECYKLVNFAFNSLKDSQYKVIIRTHPERPYDKISKDLFFEISEQKNFSVSQSKHVKDDLMVSDIVVYWGSTVSLEALKMGIPVIHIDLDDVISVDPLLDCKYLKWTVKNTCELLKVISKIYCLSDEEYKDQCYKAEAYIEEYLQEVTDKRLEEFVLQ